MASILGINRNSLSKIENNKAFPNALVLEKLAKEFNVSIDSLLDINEGKERNKEMEIKKISKYCTYLDINELDFICYLLSIIVNKKNI